MMNEPAIVKFYSTLLYKAMAAKSLRCFFFSLKWMMRIAKKFQEQICVSRLTDGQKKEF
jgi:hypothetical protein